MPIEGRTARILQARREENELQQALLRLEQKSVREQNDKVEALGRGKQEVLDVIKAAKTGPRLPPGFDFKKGELRTKTKLAEDASIKQINQRRRQERKLLSDQIDGDLKLAKQRLDSNTKVFNDFMNKNKVAIDDFDRRLADADRKRQQSSAQRSQRIGNAASSALIGGAFPLLFGQGGAAAAGGAFGGLAGGLVGGQFGFALSLVGTALGDAASKAEKFNQDLAALNARAINLGSSSIATSRNVAELARQLGKTKEETVEVLQQFSAFTDFADRASLAQVFGGDAGAAERLAAARTEFDLAQAIVEARGKLGIEEAQRLLNQLQIQDSTVVELAFVEALAKKEHEITVEKARQITLLDRFLAATSSSAFDIVDPAIFGEERAEALIKQFEENRQALRDDTLKNLQSLRELFGSAASFKPPTAPTSAESGDALEQSLNRQLARYEEIEPLARARAVIEADHQVTLERISKVQDALKRKDLEALAGKVKEARLNDLNAKEEEKRADEEARRIKTFRQRLTAAESEGRILQASLSGKEREQRLIEDIAQKTKGLSVTEAKLVEDRLRSNDALRRQKEVMDELKTKVDEIGATFKNAFVDGIQSAIDGSKTLGQVLSSMLKQLSKQLLQMGANQLFGSAKGGTGLLGIIGGAFGISGGGGGGVGVGSTNSFAGVPNSVLDSVIGKRARGGPVSRAKPYVVGERGPELFVPRTSGTVVPNSSLGGSASVTVNVDASGSSVEGDANQAGRLGKAIGIAVQQELIKQKRPGGLLGV